MPTDPQRIELKIGVVPHHRMDMEKMQKFLLDENHLQEVQTDEDGNPTLFTIEAKTEKIYFCKRIMVMYKYTRRPAKMPPDNVKLGAEDEYIHWEPVNMKRPAMCRVIGTQTLTNGIKHNAEDPIYDIIPRFEPHTTVQALLVVAGMNSKPFLIPIP